MLLFPFPPRSDTWLVNAFAVVVKAELATWPSETLFSTFWSVIYRYGCGVVCSGMVWYLALQLDDASLQCG